MTGLLEGLQITGTHLAALLLLIFALLLLLLQAARIRAGRRPQMRSLPTFSDLPTILGQSAESGHPLHFTIGPGRLGGDRTLASLAALEILEGLTDAAVAYGRPPVVTVGEPTLLPLAEDVLRRSYIRQGIPERYDPTAVRFVSAQPVVYGVGAAEVTAHEGVHGTILAGAFSEEASLIANAGEGQELSQTAVTDRPRALGVLYPARAHLGVGEELYAGAAQLTGSPRYLASLRVQDVLRFLLVAVILMKALGLF
jgi:hypothetical protein